jgi:hypothetical protein
MTSNVDENGHPLLQNSCPYTGEPADQQARTAAQCDSRSQFTK